jgi:hypothetical protein
MEMLEGNGKVPQDVRDRLLLKAMGEMIRKIDFVESISIVTILKTSPVKSIAFVTLAFVLLHEFATYVNFDLLFRGAAGILGIPIE